MEWINIKDKLPEVGQFCLTYEPYDEGKDGGIYILAEFTGKKIGDVWMWDDRQGWVGAATLERPPYPTHWAALEKPKEEDGDKD